MPATGYTRYCERCGAELLPADPAPLCATCWVSDTSVYAPSLLIQTDNAWAGTTPARSAVPEHAEHLFWGPHAPDRPGQPGTPETRRRRRSRRLTLAIACITALALALAIVPAAVSSTTPGPVHIGVQEVDKGTDACLANLYTLIADKVAHRDSPADIVCPVTGRPYIYTQYQGVTTIACPDAASHTQTRIYVRSDTRVPIVN